MGSRSKEKKRKNLSVTERRKERRRGSPREEEEERKKDAFPLCVCSGVTLPRGVRTPPLKAGLPSLERTLHSGRRYTVSKIFHTT